MWVPVQFDEYKSSIIVWFILQSETNEPWISVRYTVVISDQEDSINFAPPIIKQSAGKLLTLLTVSTSGAAEDVTTILRRFGNGVGIELCHVPRPIATVWFLVVCTKCRISSLINGHGSESRKPRPRLSSIAKIAFILKFLVLF